MTKKKSASSLISELKRKTRKTYKKMNVMTNTMSNATLKTLKFLLLSTLICITSSTQAKTVKMYLLAGQSNMQGSNSRISKLQDLINVKNSNQPAENALFTEISNYYATGNGYGYGYDAAQARVSAKAVDTDKLVTSKLLNPLPQVQIYFANYPYNANVVQTPKISKGDLKPGYGANNQQYGPELLLGHAIAKTTTDDVIFVKVAEGGSDLHEMWRSPSMEARLGKAVGIESLYPHLIQHATNVKNNPGAYFPKYAGQSVNVEVAGFVWFQGFNDQFDAIKADNYEQNLTDLIKDVRNDMNAPNMKVAIGQSHTDGSPDGLKIMDAQKNVANADSKADWAVTNDLSNYYHYDPAAMVVIGSRLGGKMAGLSQPPGGCDTIIQAENAVYGGGAKIEMNHAGYNGSGFVNLPDSGGYVEFTVQGCGAGLYELKYRHALAYGSRAAKLIVNGVESSITTNASGAWNAYHEEAITINLNAGTNTIRIESKGSDFGNLDQISLKLTSGGGGGGPTTLSLDMPRLWGEDDETSNGNTVNVIITNPSFKTYHKFTDISHKEIDVALAKAMSSGALTLSFKYIPTDSLQTSKMVTSSFLNINQTGNSITAEVNGYSLTNNKSIAPGFTCNHVVVTLDNGTFRLNHNDTWVNFNGSVPTNLQANDITFGDFPGRIWDIRLYDGVLSDSDIETLAEGCIAWKPVSNPPFPDLPYPISSAYTTLWTDSIQLHQPGAAYNEKWEYYAYAQERAYEHYVLVADMYPHAAGLKDFVLNKRRNRDLALPESGGLVNRFLRPWSWSKQHNTTNGNWWYHECFHGHQGNPEGPKKGKWMAEASAEWAPNLIWPGTRSSTLSGFFTLHPHFPIWIGNTSIDENSATDYAGNALKNYDGWGFIGGRQYGAQVALYYILNIAANDPGIMGEVYNRGEFAWKNIRDILQNRGMDLKEVFGDFSVRSSIWDFQDGSGPEFTLAEINSYHRMKNSKRNDPYPHVFDAKFSNVMDEHGTRGTWLNVPTKRKPGSWAFNAYKFVAGMGTQAYKISLRGINTNPNITEMQSRVVVFDPNKTNIRYYKLAVSNLVAQGTGSTDITVPVNPGDSIVFTVAVTPEAKINRITYDHLYDYQYKIEKTSINTAVKEPEEDEKSSWVYMTNNGLDLVVATTAYENVQMSLHDVSGKLVEFEILSGNRNQFNLDHLNRGIYLVTLTVDGKPIHTEKIMKQ